MSRHVRQRQRLALKSTALSCMGCALLPDRDPGHDLHTHKKQQLPCHGPQGGVHVAMSCCLPSLLTQQTRKQQLWA